MTKNKFVWVVFSTLLLATIACSSILPQGQDDSIPQSEGAVPRVTVEEAKAALDSGEAIIVDVRSPGTFADGHIVGALSIPLGEFEGNIANVPLDKDQWIITYCT